MALLSSPFRDAGLLGELSSLGEVAGLPLPADGLGIFTCMAKSLFSLQEKVGELTIAMLKLKPICHAHVIFLYIFEKVLQTFLSL